MTHVLHRSSSPGATRRRIAAVAAAVLSLLAPAAARAATSTATVDWLSRPTAWTVAASGAATHVDPQTESYVRSCVLAIMAHGVMAHGARTSGARPTTCADPRFDLQKPSSVHTSVVVPSGTGFVVVAMENDGAAAVFDGQRLTTIAPVGPALEPAPSGGPARELRPRSIYDCNEFKCCQGTYCCTWTGGGSPVCH